MQNKMNRKASSPRRMQKQQKEQEEVEKKIAVGDLFFQK